MFLGMRPTESATGAQNWAEKLFREIYLDKDRVSVSCENELLEFFNGSMFSSINSSRCGKGMRVIKKIK